MHPLAQFIRDRSTPLEPQGTGVDPHLEPLDDIRSVVFDVYGTLVISGSGDIGLAEAEDRESAARECLAEAGLEYLGPGGGDGEAPLVTERFHAAVRFAHARRRAYRVEHPEVDVREIWDSVVRRLQRGGFLGGAAPSAEVVERVALAYECRINPVWEMPGAAVTLRALRSGGLTLGIVSNAQFFTPLLFPALLGDDLVGFGFRASHCIWSYLQREAKPSVDLYQRLAEQLALEDIWPHQVLYLGNDIRNDVNPAREAGFRTALFAGDRRSLRLREDDPACRGVRPDLVLTALDQVPACIGYAVK